MGRFSSHQRFLLSVAAILHDVGRSRSPTRSSTSRDLSTPPSGSKILTHPEVGALIVERMGKLERAAEIIRCAHEHFDGSGYPADCAARKSPWRAASSWRWMPSMR